MSRLLYLRRHWIPLLLGVATFALYAYTAGPSIVALYDDSLEFQLVGPTFGIPHPTGYPLYTLLAGLWSRLVFPFGNWAWRMNLFSALAGAGTVSLVYQLARTLLPKMDGMKSGSRLMDWAALSAAVTFAVSPVWWSQATVAEVYTLHNLLVVGTLLVAVQIGRDPQRSGATRLAALLGLGLAHHRTILLLGPALLVYLLWKAPDVLRPQRKWVRYALGFVLPLLLYLYIPLRAAMGVHDLEGDYMNTWGGFWRHVLATGYGGFLTGNPLAVSRDVGDWFVMFREQFGLFGLLLGIVGLGAGLLHRERRAEWWLVLLALVTNAAFGLVYRVADVEVFLLPGFLFLAIGIAFTIASLLRILVHSPVFTGPSRAGALGVSLVALVLGGSVMLGLGGRGPAVDRHRDWSVHDYVVSMAKVNFPPGSLVVGLRGQITALQYMQQAEGLGQNAAGVALDDPDERRRFVAEAVAAGRPVYLTQEIDGIGNLYSFSGEGPLVRVWPRGMAEPGAPARPLDFYMPGEALRLVGYDLIDLDQAGGPGLRLTLYWLPEAPQQRVLKLSLRVLDASGAPLLVQDVFPLHQVARTTDWLPGEVVRDVHDLSLSSLPRNTAATLLVIIYDAVSVEEIGRIPLPLAP